MTVRRGVCGMLALALLVSVSLAARGKKDEEEPAPPTSTTGPAPAPDTIGDPARGETLFLQTGCEKCHAVDSDAVLAGPSLQTIATTAATREAGMDAVTYLRQSITDPGVFFAEGFSDQVMPTFSDLSEQDVNDLVAYLLTLR